MPEREHRQHYMPLDANIPEEWIVGREPGELRIAFPGWGTGKVGKTTYYITMNAETRELFCDPECYAPKGTCHHLPGLIWTCFKPKKRKGVQGNSLFAFRSFTPEKLAERHRQVYEAIRRLGKADDKDISAATKLPINCVTPRRGELRDMGVIYKWGDRLDESTDKWVAAWCVVHGVSTEGLF